MCLRQVSLKKYNLWTICIHKKLGKIASSLLKDKFIDIKIDLYVSRKIKIDR